MINILFYGNCQMTAIKQTLNLNKTKYNQTIIECFDTELTEEEFTLSINKSDIIIMNLIEDNYRNKKYLSTTDVIYHSQENCKIIILNNFYFHFYYFDIKTIEIKGELNVYHHILLFENYKNNKTVDFYIDNYINKSTLKTKYELECLANNSFEELKRRYEIILLHKQMTSDKLIYTIPISHYIKDNYKNKLLFYTNNHPSKYLFQYASEQIVDILNLENTIDYTVDKFIYTKLILYKCIQKVVFFDIQAHEPLIGDQSNINDIYQCYCNFYKNSNIEL